MSTERELTPGGPATRLHSIAYPDLAATLQLNTVNTVNSAVSILGKAAAYGMQIYYLF